MLFMNSRFVSSDLNYFPHTHLTIVATHVTLNDLSLSTSCSKDKTLALKVIEKQLELVYLHANSVKTNPSGTFVSFV